MLNSFGYNARQEIRWHLRAIAHLIETQTNDWVLPDYQCLPYWLGEALDFDPFDRWLQTTWVWGCDNARASHDNRPWQNSYMVVNHYPTVLKRQANPSPDDDIPF